MPTVSSRPRSAGGAARGGRISSTPRSSGRAASAPRGSRNPVTGVSESRSSQAARLAGLKGTGGPGPIFTPISAVLTALSLPAYAVGDTIRHPSHLIPGKGPSAIDLFRDKDKVLPGRALQERGALPGGRLGGALSFGADVLLDPTTYVAFGGGAAARAATKGASAGLTAAAKTAAAEGKRLTIADVAKAGAVRETALAAAPRALSVGFRVPFTRGKVIPLAESEHLADVGRRVSEVIGNSRVGENLREVFLPAGAGSKAAHRIGSDARRYGEAEKRVISQQASRFQAEVAKAAKKAGMKPNEAFPALVRSLDQPDKYPVPAALAPLRDDAARIFDDLRRLEDEAGIDRGLVPDYAPHLPANASVRREFERMFPQDPGRPLFFQKPRELPNLDAWEAAGLTPEYNLARLLEVRGHASVDARVLKAFDDAVGDLPVTSADVARVKEAIRPSVSGTPAIEDTKRFINGVGSSWKALALLSPGYHMRNLQSDMLSAYWAGARNPLSYVQAVKALRGGKGTIKIRGEVYTYDQLVTLAEASGAIRIGQAGKEIRGELTEAGGVRVRGAGARPSRPGHGRVARGSQAVGNAREDMVRLGTFIERMKAGDDAMAAAQRTRDFLFDYGDVGKFVRAARRFWLPFVTFPTKAVPMVGRVALQRPGTLANLNKATTALNEAGGDPDLSLLSAGSRSSFAIPAPSLLRSAIGAPQGQPILFNPESVLAYGSLNQLDPTNPVRSIGGLLNPLPKAALEAKTGYSFYFDGPGGRRVKAPAVINALAKLGAPIADYGPKRVYYPEGSPPVPGYSRKLDLFLRAFPPFSQSAGLIPGGGSDTTRLPYLRYLAGLSISPYDQTKAAYYAEKYGRK